MYMYVCVCVMCCMLIMRPLVWATPRDMTSITSIMFIVSIVSFYNRISIWIQGQELLHHSCAFAMVEDSLFHTLSAVFFRLSTHLSAAEVGKSLPVLTLINSTHTGFSQLTS